MSLQGFTIKVTNLSETEKQHMYELMTEYYDNILKENFIRDLNEKEYVVLFKNSENKVKGFSTLLIMDLEIEEEKIKAVFSGDTVMHKDHWGKMDLPFVWGRFVLMDIPEIYKESKIYWILISKGYKTYRYLPTHFDSFYPRYDKATPQFEEKIMTAFGKAKYPDSYDAETGIIKAKNTSDAVKEDIAPLTEKHLQDPDLRFFAEKNSNYQKGDELVCVIKASFSNLKPMTQQFLLGQNLNKAANM